MSRRESIPSSAPVPGPTSTQVEAPLARPRTHLPPAAWGRRRQERRSPHERAPRTCASGSAFRRRSVEAASPRARRRGAEHHQCASSFRFFVWGGGLRETGCHTAQRAFMRAFVWWLEGVPPVPPLLVPTLMLTLFISMQPTTAKRTRVPLAAIVGHRAHRPRRARARHSPLCCVAFVSAHPQTT